MFFIDQKPSAPPSPVVEKKLQSLEIRADCVSEILKLHKECIEKLEAKVNQLESIAGYKK